MLRAFISSNPEENSLLCSLPPAQRERLLPHLQPVTFLAGPGNLRTGRTHRLLLLSNELRCFAAVHHARWLNRGDGSGGK